MNKISKHISLDEAILSPTGIRDKIDNTPTPEILEAMKKVANRCFEPIREHFGIPLTVNSFYRCEALNKAVKGAKNSQHLKGEAIDFCAQHAYSDKNLEILNWAKDNLDYDQLINEYPDAKGRPCWVHISYNKEGKNRKQFLVIK
jgi:zinc D-Ala-D-Ala carboxypeptidase